MLETSIDNRFIKAVTVEFTDGTKEEITGAFVVIDNDTNKWLVRFCEGVNKERVIEFANDFLDGDEEPFVEPVKKKRPSHLILVKG